MGPLWRGLGAARFYVVLRDALELQKAKQHR
jgi:hypothetical protein